MSENTPNIPNLPPGAIPPRPVEATKVQPKKETVRINLPPKPTTAPTIKLPTPASATVTATTGAAPVATATAAAPAASTAGPSAAPRAATPKAAVATAPRPASVGMSKLDVMLAVVAAAASIAALVCVLLL